LSSDNFDLRTFDYDAVTFQYDKKITAATANEFRNVLYMRR